MNDGWTGVLFLFYFFKENYSFSDRWNQLGYPKVYYFARD